ncbi:hypothetical protein K402DRAFT_152927 [Aulographum hederae CBS 113979]|uniref:Uncharacterized protein n=1 Tax=Aulographum hederae CBS 113979 TaxID=1176131 RepID=A0A6G1GT49_9PEZI|nr:hypothetical protein K402DRAFT_152927 [Aulographum hederae CBS 113979]
MGDAMLGEPGSVIYSTALPCLILPGRPALYQIASRLPSTSRPGPGLLTTNVNLPSQIQSSKMPSDCPATIPMTSRWWVTWREQALPAGRHQTVLLLCFTTSPGSLPLTFLCSAIILPRPESAARTGSTSRSFPGIQRDPGDYLTEPILLASCGLSWIAGWPVRLRGKHNLTLAELIRIQEPLLQLLLCEMQRCV